MRFETPRQKSASPPPESRANLSGFHAARRPSTEPDHTHRGSYVRDGLELIRFALDWAPYGGPPDEETMPRFGITKDILVARIWVLVSEFDLGWSYRAALSDAYPRPSTLPPAG